MTSTSKTQKGKLRITIINFIHYKIFPKSPEKSYRDHKNFSVHQSTFLMHSATLRKKDKERHLAKNRSEKKGRKKDTHISNLTISLT
jgi:hypothetical protein